MSLKKLQASIKPLFDIISQEVQNNRLVKEEVDDVLSVLARLLDSDTPEQVLTSDDVKPLIEFFVKRWDRIQNTNLEYTASPNSALSQACFAVASFLAPIVKKTPHQILMPTIQYTEDTLGNKLENLKLCEFVLSDDKTRFIPVLDCLDLASEDGELRHTIVINGQPQLLSESERNRVINHSNETKALYQAIQKRCQFKRESQSFGAALERLMKDLTEGGAEKNGIDYEYDALPPAIEAVNVLNKWRAILTPEEQARLDALTAYDLNEGHWRYAGSETTAEDDCKNFKEILERLLLIDHERKIHDFWEIKLPRTLMAVLSTQEKSAFNIGADMSKEQADRVMDSLRKENPTRYAEVRKHVVTNTEDEKGVLLGFRLSIYCVDKISEKIGRILKAHPELYDMVPINIDSQEAKKFLAEFNADFDTTKTKLNTAMKSPAYQVKPPYSEDGYFSLWRHFANSVPKFVQVFSDLIKFFKYLKANNAGVEEYQNVISQLGPSLNTLIEKRLSYDSRYLPHPVVELLDAMPFNARGMFLRALGGDLQKYVRKQGDLTGILCRVSDVTNRLYVLDQLKNKLYDITKTPKDLSDTIAALNLSVERKITSSKELKIEIHELEKQYKGLMSPELYKELTLIATNVYSQVCHGSFFGRSKQKKAEAASALVQFYRGKISQREYQQHEPDMRKGVLSMLKTRLG